MFEWTIDLSFVNAVTDLSETVGYSWQPGNNSSGNSLPAVAATWEDAGCRSGAGTFCPGGTTHGMRVRSGLEQAKMPIRIMRNIGIETSLADVQY